MALVPDPNEFWLAEIHDQTFNPIRRQVADQSFGIASASNRPLLRNTRFADESNPEPAGLILVHPSKPNLYILNHSAAFLWNALKAGVTNEQLPRHLANHFGIPITQAAADVAATLESWSQSLLAPIGADENAAPNNVNPPFRAATVTESVSWPPALSRESEANCSDEPYQHIFHFSLGTQSFRLLSSDAAFVAEIRPRLAHLLITADAVPQRQSHAQGDLVASTCTSGQVGSSSAPTHTFHVTRSYRDNALSVFSNGTLLGSVAEPAEARVLLLPEIARLAHQPAPKWLAILHAAALAHPLTNEAVLLAAPTGSGKTTLTAALTHSGFRLLSDDSSAITADESPKVLPLPFALMLRSGSWPVLTPYFPEIPNLPIDARYEDSVCYLSPPHTSIQSAVPKYLVFSRYDPTIRSTNCQPISSLQAFYHLEKSGFWIDHSQGAVAAFTLWISSLRSYQLQYSDLSEAIVFIRNLLGRAL